MSSDPPSKKEQLLKLLDRGSVFVHLDPRRTGVRVPPWLAVKPQLVLQLGRNFAIPIPDLVVDDVGVRCTLSFNRSPFHCDLPWSAVYALVAEDGQMTFWPTELPSELVPEPVPVRRNQPTTRSAQPRTKPRISVVPDGAQPAPPEPAPEPPAAPTPAPSRFGRAAPSAAPALALPTDGGEDDRSRPESTPRPSSRPPGSKTPRERPPWLRVVK